MMPEHQDDADAPSPEEIRAALEKMVASDVFRASPQLAEFLRFVVEAVLRGDSDRIKGYTIGVEALGRPDNFDPQIDPIVRVEATRLRRALERYYTVPGADDPLIIGLPRGSYVPVIRRRAKPRPQRARVMLRPYLGPRRIWLAALTGATVLGVLLLMLGLQSPERIVPPSKGGIVRGAEQPIVTTLPPGNGMPMLAIEPLDVIGTPGPNSISVAALVQKMRSAFSRFATINIVVEPDKAAATSERADASPHADYRITGSIEYRPDGSATVNLQLLDTAEGSVVGGRSFEIPASVDRAHAEEDLVLDLATTLLQPYGVLPTRERRKHLAGKGGDPRYRCLLEATEAYRTFDPAQRERARACLERLTALDPSFAAGFAHLAVIYYLPALFLEGAPDAEAERAALDRALEVARRAVELAPESQLSHQSLALIHFARREKKAAFAALERAVALNPYDMRVLGLHGSLLVAAGEVDKGIAVLERAAKYGTVRPHWEHVFASLAYYVRGDIKAATEHAHQAPGNNFPMALVDQALVAAAEGNREKAQRIIDQLVASRPAWRTDPRSEIARVISSPELADRLAQELESIGLKS